MTIFRRAMLGAPEPTVHGRGLPWARRSTYNLGAWVARVTPAELPGTLADLGGRYRPEAGPRALAERLTALDATFLELEEADQGAHMHIGE